MLTFPVIWDLCFSSFQMFVGVGIIWLIFIEPRIPSRSLSVTLMIIVAIAATTLNFFLGFRKVRREWLAGQKLISDIEAAAVEYEGEIV